MNPKLVKFAVELQTGEKVEKKEDKKTVAKISTCFLQVCPTSPIPISYKEK